MGDIEKAWRDYLFSLHRKTSTAILMLKHEIKPITVFNSGFIKGHSAALSKSGWVKLEDMPDEWKVDGTPLAVWGWPDYKSADEDGTDETKIVGFGRWDDKYGNVYGMFCNSHFTITHVKKTLPPQPSELE